MEALSRQAGQLEAQRLVLDGLAGRVGDLEELEERLRVATQAAVEATSAEEHPQHQAAVQQRHGATP